MEGIGGVCFSMVQHDIQREEERREEKRARMEGDSIYTLHT